MSHRADNSVNRLQDDGEQGNQSSKTTEHGGPFTQSANWAQYGSLAVRRSRKSNRGVVVDCRVAESTCQLAVD